MNITTYIYHIGSCPMAELVTASDCYVYIVVMLSEGHEFEPH